MKKILLVLLIIVIATVVGSYIFISNNIVIAKAGLLNTNTMAAFRCLTQKDMLQQFLKNDESTLTNDSAYFFQNNDISFQFKPRMFDVVEVPLRFKNLRLQSFISFRGLSPDSTVIEWKTKMETSNNPIKRIKQYLQAKKIHEGMSYVLDQLRQFVSNKKNVYGLNIMRTRLTDSLLVTTKMITKKYPSEQEYYNLIKHLQDFIVANGASSTNYPMLNIAKVDSNSFVTTVAVPINKVLPDKGAILFKKMFPGNILTAEVKSGIYSIEKGFMQLDYYVSDHQLASPAIPFQSLITDRLAEADTSKWMTKLYYPIY